MWTPVCCLSLLLLGVLVLADDESVEVVAIEPVDDSIEAFRYFVPDVDLDADSLSFDDDGRNRREIVTTLAPEGTDEQAPPKKILFSDLIGKVEGSIVQSSVKIAQLLKTSKGSTALPSTTESSASEAIVEKVKRSSVTENPSAAAKDTVVNYVTTKKETVDGEQHPRVAVDHVAVSDAKNGLGPLLFSLDFFANQAPKLVVSSLTSNSKDGVTHQSGSLAQLTVVTPKGATHLPTSTEAISSSSTTSSSERAGSSVSTPSASSATSKTETSTSSAAASSTKATSTAEASVSTSPKTPIEKLKEVEDDLKEKVAEIEAEPPTKINTSASDLVT